MTDHRSRFHRDEESATPGFIQWLKYVIEFRPVAYAVWSAFGGAVVLGFMRLAVIDRLKAEEIARANADSVIEVEVKGISTQMLVLRNNQRANLKAVCLDHTKAEQARIFDIDVPSPCPADLYRGAMK